MPVSPIPGPGYDVWPIPATILPSLTTQALSPLTALVPTFTSFGAGGGLRLKTESGLDWGASACGTFWVRNSLADPVIVAWVFKQSDVVQYESPPGTPLWRYMVLEHNPRELFTVGPGESRVFCRTGIAFPNLPFTATPAQTDPDPNHRNPGNAYVEIYCWNATTSILVSSGVAIAALDPTPTGSEFAPPHP